MTVIPGTIQKGEILTESALSLFPDGTQVYVISREDFNRIAGSDSARHRAQKAEEALQVIEVELAQTRQALTEKETELTAVKGEVVRK